MSVNNTQWILASRPVGPIAPENFAWRETPATKPAEGEVLVRQVYLSLDPAMRGWMREGGSYAPAVPLGSVMRGGGVGVVVESRAGALPPGTIVQGSLGWQTYATLPARALLHLPLPPHIPLLAQSALFNHIGLTAYFGLLEIGRPREGETLVVSGAAGAVGSLVVQLGKIAGLRVIGIAGTEAKCRYLTEELGADGALNYKNAGQGRDLRKALRALCPDGIDVVFENVGGEILDASLAQLNLRARVVLCGLISMYNATGPVPGPTNFAALITRRARAEGFIVSDYFPRAGEALPELLRWYDEGRLRYRVEVVDGLAEAPRAINRLFTGEKTGKLVVRVSPEPQAS